MRSCAIIFLCLCLVHAQDDAFVIDIVGQTVQKTNLALPDFKLEQTSGSYDEAWSTINQVLRADLANAGYFNLLGRDRLNLVRSPHIGAIDFQEWSSIEAHHLIVGNILDTEEGMRTEVRLYEVGTGQTILAKAYKSRPDLARKTAHTIADDILMQLRNTSFASAKVLFSRQTMRQVGDENRPVKEIWMMDYDGQNQTPITRGGIAVMPSAVQVGENTLVAYCSYDSPYSFHASYGIYFKPNLVSRPRPLFVDRARRASSPSLSPDGKKVLFALAENGNVDLYIMNTDGSDLLRLTRHPGIDTNPSWSPSGHAVLFTSDRTGSPQIYTMDADGLNLRRVTYDNPYNDMAVWNPRYDYIAYTSRFENDFDIFIMDLKTGKNYRVTKTQGSNEDPCWAPDGERLIFTSNRTGEWQLYFINRNGENLRQLTRNGDNRRPVWVQ